MIIPVYDPCRPLARPSLYDLSRPLEVEVGCGRGRFLTGRAARHPECEFLGIERMRARANAFDAKTRRLRLDNAHVVRLEALYTFWYLLPAHHARRVWVFFPDPWPKRKHHSHRLFGPLFLTALWKRLEIGGDIQFATDHEEYFRAVEGCFARDRRFARTDPAERGPGEWTEFETLFRGQGLPIHAAAWRSLPADDAELEPLAIRPEDEPRAGVFRRECRGREWREAQKAEQEA
ncbi:MAG: tRNA (guanine(46)-N(7))-methyltransferase TrmB [Kiritimatiellia bacterium]